LRKPGLIPATREGASVVEKSKRRSGTTVRRTHKARREQTRRVCCPIPIGNGDRWIDGSQHDFEAIDQLTVPREKRWAAVDVCSLMDLVLLVPEGHNVAYLMQAILRIPAIEGNDIVHQPGSLERGKGGRVPARLRDLDSVEHIGCAPYIRARHIVDPLR